MPSGGCRDKHGACVVAADVTIAWQNKKTTLRIMIVMLLFLVELVPVISQCGSTISSPTVPNTSILLPLASTHILPPIQRLLASTRASSFCSIFFEVQTTLFSRFFHQSSVYLLRRKSNPLLDRTGPARNRTSNIEEGADVRETRANVIPPPGC